MEIGVDPKTLQVGQMYDFKYDFKKVDMNVPDKWIEVIVAKVDAKIFGLRRGDYWHAFHFGEFDSTRLAIHGTYNKDRRQHKQGEGKNGEISIAENELLDQLCKQCMKAHQNLLNNTQQIRI